MTLSLHHSTSSRQARVVVFRNDRGQVVGTLRAGWLEKSVNTNIHRLRKPLAWAIDRAHLDQLQALSARGVRLSDEQGREWTATLDLLTAKGFRLDRGHGEQVGLILRYWTVRLPGTPAQASFFDEVA
jgi:hypothetical protein